MVCKHVAIHLHHCFAGIEFFYILVLQHNIYVCKFLLSLMTTVENYANELDSSLVCVLV